LEKNHSRETAREELRTRLAVVKRFLETFQVVVAVKAVTVKAGTMPSSMIRQAQTR
jgi:hypothetical protein